MMKPQMLKKYSKILQGLLEEGEMNFQQVVDIVHNRDAALDRLSTLIKMGYVTDLRSNLGKGHGKGPARRLKLTINGEKQALEIAANDLNAALKTITRMMVRFAQDPSKMKKWQTARRKAAYNLRVPQELSDEQKGQTVREHVSQHQERWDRPMLECLRIVHEVYLSTCEPPPGLGSLVGITKRGDSYEQKVIPEKQVPELFPEK